MNDFKRLGLACAAAASLVAVGGCADDYGYGGPAVAYGAGYDGYYDGVYGSYGDPYYGQGYPGYYGWYGGFYYPGSGLYVYDRDRRPYRWNGDQRRYWSGQQRTFRGSPNGQGLRPGANWGGFDHGRGGGAGAGAARPAGQAFRGGGVRAGGHGGGHRRR